MLMNTLKVIFTFIFKTIFKTLKISFGVVKWLIVVVVFSSIMMILGSFRGANGG